MHRNDTNHVYMTEFDEHTDLGFDPFSTLDENISPDWLSELTDKPEHSYNDMNELNEDEIIPELTEALGEESFQKISDILKDAEMFQPAMEPVTTFPMEGQLTTMDNFTPSQSTTYTDLTNSNTYMSHTYEPQFDFNTQTHVELNQELPTTVADNTSNESTTNSDPDYIPTTSTRSRPIRRKNKGKQPIGNKLKVKSTKGRKRSVKAETEEILPKENETYSQAVRRVKNNAASRLHRSKKRNNLTTMEQREEDLKYKNIEIGAQLERLDKIAQILKTGLVNHRTQPRVH